MLHSVEPPETHCDEIVSPTQLEDLSDFPANQASADDCGMLSILFIRHSIRAQHVVDTEQVAPKDGTVLIASLPASIH